MSASPGSQNGLTLVEMLIALVLSSIIFISAYQVISNLVQYQVRARVLSDRQMDNLLMTNMFGQIMEKGIHQSDLHFNVAEQPLFEGRQDSLQLVSRAYSERYDRPGHRIYRMYRRDGELYLSYQAFDENYLDNEQFELATGLKIVDLSFEYFAEGGWIEEWSDDRSIPEFIRTIVEFPGSQSAEWIKGTGRR